MLMIWLKASLSDKRSNLKRQKREKIKGFESENEGERILKRGKKEGETVWKEDDDDLSEIWKNVSVVVWRGRFVEIPN